MMDKILLNLITLCHIVLIGCVIGIPFTSNNYLLTLHFMLTPFMMAHWYMNDHTCCLTLMEKQIRKNLNMTTNEKDCFTCQLIEPVYDFKANNEEWATFLYVITSALWLISAYKLYSMYSRGEITTTHDLLFKENTTKLF